MPDDDRNGSTFACFVIIVSLLDATTSTCPNLPVRSLNNGQWKLAM